VSGQFVLPRFAAAYGASLIAAGAFYASLRSTRATRTTLLVVVSLFILATPAIVPPQARLLRCVAAVNAVTTVIKLLDVHLGANGARRPGLRSFLGFLVNIFGLVHRKLEDLPRPPWRSDARRLVWNGLGFVGAAALVAAAFQVDWRSLPFVAEHATKVVAFFLALIPLSTAAAAAWRLAGGRGLDFMDNPFAARTPADFWRRYNRPVHQFMEQDVFLPLGGRRQPLWAAVAVFVVSAAIHEYLFSTAVGRVQGYQTGFFLVQGLAVAATARVKPRGVAAGGWVAATFAFNLLTGVLFFASVNRVLPFYDNPVPLWDEPRPGRECRRAYASNPGSAANGGRSNSRTESISSTVGRSATFETRSFGASHTALDLKFSSSKHKT
jgi:hypothetical protein